jgi:hypothetical protein
MSDSVHLRNAKALDARNKQMAVDFDALRERVKHLENQVAMHGQYLRDAQQTIAAALTARGNGPTSR